MQLDIQFYGNPMWKMHICIGLVAVFLSYCSSFLKLLIFRKTQYVNRLKQEIFHKMGGHILM